MTKTAYTLNINGKPHTVKASPDTPLLWALRDSAKLTGTKYGCGVGICGACTVLADGVPTRSCGVPIETLDETVAITTIEGFAEAEPYHPVLEAWNEIQVPQCGYCQSGQILAAKAFLEDNPTPSAAEIKEGMTNLCRCGTYNEIAAAIALAASSLEKSSS
ncbi:MAG: (2Fe-2S)-binding protein [Pseudomonadota bacterium]